MLACFWTVGTRRTWREPLQPWGDYANARNKGPRPGNQTSLADEENYGKLPNLDKHTLLSLRHCFRLHLFCNLEKWHITFFPFISTRWPFQLTSCNIPQRVLLSQMGCRGTSCDVKHTEGLDNTPCSPTTTLSRTGTAVLFTLTDGWKVTLPFSCCWQIVMWHRPMGLQPDNQTCSSINSFTSDTQHTINLKWWQYLHCFPL